MGEQGTVRAWGVRWHWGGGGRFPGLHRPLVSVILGSGLWEIEKGRWGISPWGAPRLREKGGPSFLRAPSLSGKTQPLSWDLGTYICAG